MKVWFVVTLGVILSVSSVLGNVCSGRQNGAQVPNSADCSSYYVCDYGMPKLVKCSANLLYDQRLGVCNWPENVSCGQVIVSAYAQNTTEELTKLSKIKTFLFLLIIVTVSTRKRQQQ